MSWIVYALLAAVLWGINYALSEQLLKHFTMPFVMLTSYMTTAVFGLALGLGGKGFANDIDTVKKLGTETGFLAAGIVVAIAASTFIFLSIKAKNATMAGMIEITYPLFTALFIWAFFKETQFTAGTIFGAFLIITGVAFIYFYDKTA